MDSSAFLIALVIAGVSFISGFFENEEKPKWEVAGKAFSIGCTYGFLLASFYVFVFSNSTVVNRIMWFIPALTIITRTTSAFAAALPYCWNTSRDPLSPQNRDASIEVSPAERVRKSRK